MLQLSITLMQYSILVWFRTAGQVSDSLRNFASLSEMTDTEFGFVDLSLPLNSREKRVGSVCRRSRFIRRAIEKSWKDRWSRAEIFPSWSQLLRTATTTTMELDRYSDIECLALKLNSSNNQCLRFHHLQPVLGNIRSSISNPTERVRTRDENSNSRIFPNSACSQRESLGAQILHLGLSDTLQEFVARNL